MEKRAVKQVLKACHHALAPNERVEHACRAGIVPSSRSHHGTNVVSAAASVAMTAALGGAMTQVIQGRRYFLVLTQHRLLFVDMDPASARPLPNVRFELPRDGLTAQRVSSFPSGKILLHGPQGTEICVLYFPLGVRLDGTNLLRHLTTPGTNAPHNVTSPPVPT
jgi:hypothetical protein